MPEGFSGTLPVRHADGSSSIVKLVPERVDYLPTLNDRLAILSRLLGMFIAMLVGVTMVWARPSLMTWSLLLSFVSALPMRLWLTCFLAFEATGPGLDLRSVLPASTWSLAVAVLPFALCFPRAGLDDWALWKRVLFLATLMAVVVGFPAAYHFSPFASDAATPFMVVLWTSVATLALLAAIAALLQTYRRSGDSVRARLKWTLLGISGALVGASGGFLLIVVRAAIPNALSGSVATPGHWLTSVFLCLVLPLSVGYAVLCQRVVDIQFAISRTVVYGLVSTIVVVFLAVLHWLLGRVIEHSGFAFGIEGLAAVGLGLVLHRASHGINTTVDRVLFRKHHAAEERLRRVTAALPYASTEGSIAEALVNEPAHNLALASAALFYRDSPEGPLRRVRSQGWSESHASSLDPESFLVRYLLAEHTAVRLDDEQQWLPTGMPEGTADPVLAIPIVSQHALAAVVLYGSHVNGTLPDSDEVELLVALARAAAASHQQVRIATLQRENASLLLEKKTQQALIDRFESKLGALAHERGAAEGHWST
jgi:hypothetical protein